MKFLKTIAFSTLLFLVDSLHAGNNALVGFYYPLVGHYDQENYQIMPLENDELLRGFNRRVEFENEMPVNLSALLPQLPNAEYTDVTFLRGDVQPPWNILFHGCLNVPEGVNAQIPMGVFGAQGIVPVQGGAGIAFNNLVRASVYPHDGRFSPNNAQIMPDPNYNQNQNYRFWVAAGPYNNRSVVSRITVVRDQNYANAVVQPNQYGTFEEQEAYWRAYEARQNRPLYSDSADQALFDRLYNTLLVVHSRAQFAPATSVPSATNSQTAPAVVRPCTLCLLDADEEDDVSGDVYVVCSRNHTLCRNHVDGLRRAVDNPRDSLGNWQFVNFVCPECREQISDLAGPFAVAPQGDNSSPSVLPTTAPEIFVDDSEDVQEECIICNETDDLVRVCGAGHMVDRECLRNMIINSPNLLCPGCQAERIQIDLLTPELIRARLARIVNDRSRIAFDATNAINRLANGNAQAGDYDIASRYEALDASLREGRQLIRELEEPQAAQQPSEPSSVAQQNNQGVGPHVAPVPQPVADQEDAELQLAIALSLQEAAPALATAVQAAQEDAQFEQVLQASRQEAARVEEQRADQEEQDDIVMEDVLRASAQEARQAAAARLAEEEQEAAQVLQAIEETQAREQAARRRQEAQSRAQAQEAAQQARQEEEAVALSIRLEQERQATRDQAAQQAVQQQQQADQNLQVALRLIEQQRQEIHSSALSDYEKDRALAMLDSQELLLRRQRAQQTRQQDQGGRPSLVESFLRWTGFR